VATGEAQREKNGVASEHLTVTHKERFKRRSKPPWRKQRLAALTP